MAREPIEFQDHPYSYLEARGKDGYRGIVQYIVDGDTIDVYIDLGFRDYKYIAVRLADIDAPEIYGVPEESEEFKMGMVVKERVEELALHEPCMVYTTGEKSFNRWEGYVSIMYDEAFPGAWEYVGNILLEEELVKLA